jgi:hypothetical protein
MAGLEGHGIPIEGVSFPQAKGIMARARRYYPVGGPGAARAGNATGAGTRAR